MIGTIHAYRWIALCLGVVLAAVGTVRAQQTGVMPRQLDGTGLEQRLGGSVPLDASFQNEMGETVALSTFFDGERPVLLAPIYHNCPMLCNMVLDGMTSALREMNWTPGEQFEVVALSFNERETSAIASEKKAMYLDMLGRPGAASGLHFLTGDEASIRAVTDAVGFKFRWVEEEQTFAHPSTLIFLNGDGTISRYLTGIDYKPRDVRTALVEASEGRIGSVVDQVILYCFQYDPNANSYVPHALNLMKAGGGLTVVLLGLMLFVYWRRESHRSWQQA